ncbi:hypothetical protein C8F01DRAFT_1030215 [Mycena amicta]|nr:hypothetical protein C8F01DRAFT_1030215 [Mycena amicta]
MPEVEPEIKAEPTEVGLPSNLCPYCDELLPGAPSDELLRRADVLNAISMPSPIPENPAHRYIDLGKCQDYCSRHRISREAFPMALAQRWPQSPDFGTLFRRVTSKRDLLQAILQVPDNSFFYLTAKMQFESRDGSTRQLLSATGQYNRADGLAKLGAAYYGEIGWEIIYKALDFLFPDNLSRPQCKTALPYALLVREVLLPETVMRLVQDDLGISDIAAKAVVQSSHGFGQLLHPAADHPAVNEVDQYLARHRPTARLSPMA